MLVQNYQGAPVNSSATRSKVGNGEGSLALALLLCLAAYAIAAISWKWLSRFREDE